MKKKEVNDKADLLGESELTSLQFAYFNFVNMFKKLVSEAKRQKDLKVSLAKRNEVIITRINELKEEANRTSSFLTPESHLKIIKHMIDFLFPFDD